jgi:hypothetical protein
VREFLNYLEINMGKKGSYNKNGKGSARIHRREAEPEVREPVDNEDGEQLDEEEEDFEEAIVNQPLTTRVALWEFGQNDPKRLSF